MFKKTFLCLCIIIPVITIAQNKIDLLILNNDYSGALSLLDEEIGQHPDASLYFKKSLVLKKQMLYPQALQQIDEAIKLDSINTSFLMERADLCESLGDYDSAVKNYRHALSIQPDDLLIKFNLGQTFIRINDYKNAVKTFEKIYAVDSTNVMFNKYFALATYKAGLNEKAVGLYEKYIVQNPNDLSAYINMAKAYGEMKNDKGAFNALISAKRIFPNNKTVDLKLANSYFGAKKFEDASRYYKEYMEKYDTTTPILMNYGICLYHTKHEQEAIDVLEQCYSELPNDPYINFYLGVSHKKLENYDLAANYIDFAIWISLPEFLPEMYHHLGQVYVHMNEYAKSIEAFNKAYELDNRKVEVLFEIATTYEKFNFNKTMALNYYKTYLLEAGEGANNADYALTRMNKIKEELFFEK